MKWDNLTMSQKQALMKIYVNNGVTNLDEIVNHYNRFSEGGSKETVESPNTVLYSRTPRESVGNVVNTRPVPGLITMTEVPKIGAGINIPMSKAINDILSRRAASNNANAINVDSINANRLVSYITRPKRINRFDEGGDTDNIIDSNGYYTTLEGKFAKSTPENPITKEDLDKDYRKHIVADNKKYFIENWLSNRLEHLAENDEKITVGKKRNKGEKILDRQISNLVGTSEYINKYYQNGLFPSIFNNRNAVNAEKQSLIDKGYDAKSIEEIPDKDITILNILRHGALYPNDGFIAYEPYPETNTIIHERTHALYPSEQKNAIYRGMIKYSDKKENKSYLNENIQERDFYLDSTNEIYARLMEFRYLNNLDPNKVYTEEDIEKWKKDKNIKDTNLLSRYSNEFLLHLFNEVADNSTDSNTENKDFYYT